MSGSSSPDYKALFLREASLRRQAEDEKRQAEERERQERGQTRPTTFPELIQHCHDLLWTPIQVQTPSRSTTGKIPAPIGKHCPVQLLPWNECETRQREIYRSVCRYLQPAGVNAPQLFTSFHALKEYGRRVALRPISSELDLQKYERFAVEDYVHYIVAELCKVPEAREEFRLGNGVWFDNHTNALDQDDEADASLLSNIKPSKLDQSCIHRIDGNRSTLLTTIECKPPHKLTVASLQKGLRPMNFWREVVLPDCVLTEEPEKSRCHAERLVGSVIVQEFHVIIQEGLEFSYLTNGLMDVQLWVPYDDPSALYYHLSDPGLYKMAESKILRTRIERALYLYLMSFRTPLRDQSWRNAAKDKLPKWHLIFDSDCAQIVVVDLLRDLRVGDANPESISPEQSTSKYLASSSPTTSGPRVTTRAAATCAPLSNTYQYESSSDSEVDLTTSAGRKRGYNRQGNQKGQSRSHDAPYYIQKCLLWLAQGGTLDLGCPNTKLHILGRKSDCHSVSIPDLVKRLKVQLDLDLDHNCTPIGPCGSSGAPFKITCATFGYTVIGKGTTSKLWGEVSPEADIYRVL
ncbi:unnamed protein product [Penicillium olsonii]|nr:unnamed protein product [Penicillium olsonii]CAG7927318.1 unnamed protein product [Penicillium olsonii]